MAADNYCNPVPKAASVSSARCITSANIPRFIPHFENYSGGIPSFLSANSAKVLKSQKADEPWANVILYHSPADRAMLSFIHYFGESMARSLFASVKEAAKKKKEWRDFAFVKQSSFEKFMRDYRKAASGVSRDYKLPDGGNMISPLSLCPYATKECRAVCLNSSGQAGMGKLSEDQQRKRFLKAHKQDLPKGITLADELKYFLLHDVPVGEKIGAKGKKSLPFYGAEQNAVQAARTKRTHLMWLAWVLQGPIRNFYNDILYKEVQEYVALSRYPVAVRFNGTSDIPVHTLELTNGKNLIKEIGKLGVICYDYTKSYARMRDWIASQPRARGGKWDWTTKGGDKTRMLRVPGTGKAAFPSNYHLSFSYSEWNVRRSIDILRRGGNVVMVFAPSKRDFKRRITSQMLKSRWKLPELFSMGALTGKAGDRKLVVSVVNGDKTDIRFSDPCAIGTGKIGVIAGITPKGEAAGPDYSVEDRRRMWNRFVQLVSQKNTTRGMIAIPRKNPEGHTISGQGVDPDLLKETIEIEGRYRLAPTSAGV